MVTDRCSTLGLLFILYGEYGASGNAHFGLFRLVSFFIGPKSHSFVMTTMLSRLVYIFLPHISHLTLLLFSKLFLSLAILDISSHWCQMYSTASLQIHHKSAEGNADRFFLVRWYYQCYPFFGYCCVSAEITYVTLYVLGHTDDELLVTIGSTLLKILVPGCATKQIVNVFQLCSSCYAVAEHDAKLKNKQS